MTGVIDSFRRMLRISDEDSKVVDEESKALRRYDFIEELNHGAFSKVYRGRDKQTGQEIAIKKMPKAKLKPKQKEHILREAAIHKRLHHPNIVQFIDFFETSEHYYLIMELMKGGELFARIERVDCFTEDDAVLIITQVAKGIKYLHDNGVVHRDMKPENLVFANNTSVPIKICDFGLSKTLDQGSTDTPCGTVGYLAPEIAKEQAHNFSVDIWGLGCVLYSLLCGFPVFYDQSISVLTEKVKRGIYDFPSPWWDNVSDSAKDLIRHCLIVDPIKRYTINQFLAHPWLQTSGNLLPLASPAIIRQIDSQVVPLRTVFDVSVSVSRGIVDGYTPVINKPTFSLSEINNSTLLGKRKVNNTNQKV